jgi:hypothetical protein
LKTVGEAFTDEEVKELMSFAGDPDKGIISYERYLTQLTEEKE